MLAFAFALGVGIAVTPRRRLLVTPGTAIAALLAAVIVAPNLLWQAAHGWPQIELLHNAAAHKDEVPALPLFLLEQALLMGPLAALLWIAGLWRLLASRGSDARLAPLGWAYVVLLCTDVALRAKVYYCAPVYPMLIAAGAPVLECLSAARRPWRPALAAAIVAVSVAILPAATPILPLRDFLTYERVLDLRSVKMERHATGLVPQHFADQLGWETLVRTIAHASARLSPDERRSAAILTGDYGQAAALQFLGRGEQLPPVISGHNQYYLWGSHGDHPVVLAIGVPRALLAREYRSIIRVATYSDPYVLPYANHLPVYLCRAPREPLPQFWPHLRRYI
jgi:hypothetical protein